jgi:hypothetical protein
MTETYEGTVSFELPEEDRPILLADLLNGGIYEIPDSMKESSGSGVTLLRNLPLTDIPMLLTFGDFLR